MDEKEIENEEREIYKQLDEIKEKKKRLSISRGKAFYCKKCKRFVEKSSVSTEEENLGMCYSCHRKKKLLERKKNLLDKLKGARVIDINSSGFDSLTGLALYSNGILFELKVRGDDDEQWIDVVETKKQLMEEAEVRPGSKPRMEKSLERYIGGG